MFFGKVPEDEEEQLLKDRSRAQAFVRLLGHLCRGKVIDFDSLLPVTDHLLFTEVSEESDEGFQRVPPKAFRRCPTSPTVPPKAWIECACELLKVSGKDLVRSGMRGKATLVR
eukprot:13614311-Heterocapsa_arctica.AAC.1